MWIDFLGGEVWVRANLNGFKRLEYPVCFGDPKFGSVSRFQLPANNSPGATQCDSGVKVHANANMWVVCNLDEKQTELKPNNSMTSCSSFSMNFCMSSHFCYRILPVTSFGMREHVARCCKTCCSMLQYGA